MDRHDPHRVVVGLGQRRSRRPARPRCPAASPTRGSRASVPPTASAYARAWSTTKRTRRATSRKRPVSDADLEHVTLAHDALEQLARRRPTMRSRVQLAEEAHRVGDRIVGRQRLGRRRGRMSQRPSCSTWYVKRSSSPQPNSDERSALTSASVVARVVDRPQRHQQVADLAACRRRASSSRRGTGCRPRRAPVRGSRATCAPAAGCRCRRAGRGAPLVARPCRRPASPRRSRRAPTAATSARLALAQLVGVGTVRRAARRRAARRRGPARRGRDGPRSSARYSGCEPGAAGSARANTWLIHASTGGGRCGSCT